MGKKARNPVQAAGGTPGALGAVQQPVVNATAKATGMNWNPMVSQGLQYIRPQSWEGAGAGAGAGQGPLGAAMANGGLLGVTPAAPQNQPPQAGPQPPAYPQGAWGNVMRGLAGGFAGAPQQQPQPNRGLNPGQPVYGQPGPGQQLGGGNLGMGNPWLSQPGNLGGGWGGGGYRITDPRNMGLY